MIIKVLITAFVFLPVLVLANEDFTSLENDLLTIDTAPIANQQIEEVDDDGFVDVNWSVFQKENKLNYVITIVLAEEDIPSKVTINIIQDQIKVSLGRKVQFIKIPKDVDIENVRHRLIEDKIKFELPKKRLKSII